jgi:hypothetical protein
MIRTTPASNPLRSHGRWRLAPLDNVRSCPRCGERAASYFALCGGFWPVYSSRDGTSAIFYMAVSITVPVIDPVRAAFSVRGTGQAFNFEHHQGLPRRSVTSEISGFGREAGAPPTLGGTLRRRSSIR